MTILDSIADADANVYDALSRRFPGDRSKIAVESFDGRKLAYGDIAPITARFSGLLRDCGVRKGDRVAGVLEKSPEGVFLYLAVCRLGAIYMPIHNGLTLPEIAHILSDAEPKVVVCAPSFSDGIAGLKAKGVEAIFSLDAFGRGTFIDRSTKLPFEMAVEEGTGADANAIVYTSGTTGKPKGAVITNGAVLWNAWALSKAWELSAQDTLLHANPMAYGLFGTAIPAISQGARILMLPKLDVDQVIEHLPQSTVFSGTPTYYTRLLSRPDFDRALCRSMRLFVTGSAPMRADVFEQFRARTGHTLLDRYGLTEALLVTSNLAREERRPDTSGLPLEGSSLRIVDENGKKVPAGIVGKIEIMQPYPFTGYWKAPEKTAATFTPDGWMITGDFGRVDAAGYLTVLGRGVDLIITGGFNVYPKEIETFLNAVDNVAESAVVGVPHPDFGEAVVAAVELFDPGKSFDAAAVIAAMKKELTGYKIPKRIEVIESMPRNTLGKIQKNLIKKRMSETT